MAVLQTLWNSAPVSFLRLCVKLYVQKQIAQAAAALAYFLLLTIFPLLICVCAFLGLLNLDPTTVVAYIEGFVPQAGLDVIKLYLEYVSGQQSAALFTAGLVMAFTTSLAAFRAIRRSLSAIYEMPIQRGVRGLVISLLSPFALIGTLFISIGVIVTGDWLLEWLAREFQWQQVLQLWHDLRFLFLFLVFLLFLVAVSLVSAPRHTPRGPLLAGSLLSACALVGFSMLFSYMISLSARYSLVYGSLLSTVVLILWLYFCGNILLAGNIISSAWRKREKAPKADA